MSAILKLDLFAPAGRGVAAEIKLPAGTVCGEPLFVPRNADAAAAGTAALDDGWRLTFAEETASQTSRCLVRARPHISLFRASTAPRCLALQASLASIVREAAVSHQEAVHVALEV